MPRPGLNLASSFDFVSSATSSREPAPANARVQLLALGSLGVGVILVAAKVVVGVLTGSLGILSEAVHSGLDLVASGFALFAIRAAAKPPDPEHPYGHGRAENLSAFAEGILLLLTAAGIAYEAVARLRAGGGAVDAAWYALALLAASMLIESGRAYVLGRSGSEALEADAGNRLSDVLSSLGVLIGLLGVRYGYRWADSVAALAVAALVGFTAIHILRRSGDILIDRAPAGAEVALRKALGCVTGVREVRSVRVRRSGSQLFADARVSTRRTLSVEAAEALSSEASEAAGAVLPGIELVLAVEGQQLPANLVERVHATVARQGLMRDLHNVTVEMEADRSLHLSMHVKLPGEMPLEDATRLVQDLEERLRRELPEVSRTDVHIEPLEPELVSGEDVTARLADLVARIRAVVATHEEVVGCRDVELSSRHGHITAHIVATMAGQLSLEQAHAIETELENEVARSFPDLHEVVARATA